MKNELNDYLTDNKTLCYEKSTVAEHSFKMLDIQFKW